MVIVGGARGPVQQSPDLWMENTGKKPARLGTGRPAAGRARRAGPLRLRGDSPVDDAAEEAGPAAEEGLGSAGGGSAPPPDVGTANYLVPWTDSECISCPGLLFTKAKLLVDHHNLVHEGQPIAFVCSKCNVYSNSKYHPTTVHAAKCKGPQAGPARPKPVEPTLSYPCEFCTMTFPTSNGLGQHERHAHPNERNDARLGLRNEPVAGPKRFERETSVRGTASSLWTPEETERLVDLCIALKGTVPYYMNVELRKHFPDKEFKQIGDKRRTKGFAVLMEQRSRAASRIGVQGESERDNQPLHSSPQPSGSGAQPTCPAAQPIIAGHSPGAASPGETASALEGESVTSPHADTVGVKSQQSRAQNSPPGEPTPIETTPAAANDGFGGVTSDSDLPLGELIRRRRLQVNNAGTVSVLTPMPTGNDWTSPTSSRDVLVNRKHDSGSNAPRVINVRRLTFDGVSSPGATGPDRQEEGGGNRPFTPVPPNLPVSTGSVSSGTGGEGLSTPPRCSAEHEPYPGQAAAFHSTIATPMPVPDQPGKGGADDPGDGSPPSFYSTDESNPGSPGASPPRGQGGFADWVRMILEAGRAIRTDSARGELADLARDVNILYDLLLAGRMPSEDGFVATINEIITRLVAILFSSDTERQPERRRGQARSRVFNKRNRANRRRILYAKTQELYKKAPDKLAEMIVENTLCLEGDDSQVKPPARDFLQLYSQLWGIPGDCQVEFGEGAEKDLFDVRPVQAIEVARRIRRVKGNSAAGPDGVVKRHLKESPGVPNVLAKIFNLLLASGKYPEQWLKNRTTLIPKPNKDRLDASNWRPITISSILARLYSGVLDFRLRSLVTLSASQRGFMPLNGCYRNCRVLHELLQIAKRGFPLVGVLLDISKAFDSVPREAILRALRRQGVPEHIVRIVSRMYEGATTELGVDGNPIVPILRGVKQGDPLSPILFNIVMDALITELESSPDGFTVDNHTSVGVLAFADDLILLSDTVEGAQRLIDKVRSFLEGLGMNLAARKSTAFQIVQAQRAWAATDPGLKVGETPIPYAKVADPIKYLGVTYTLQSGYTNPHSTQRLVEAAERLLPLALKPLQKLELLATYMLPKFLYTWSIAMPSKTNLTRLDTAIRQVVKQIFHLHGSTTDYVVYAKCRNGGLGVPRLSQLIPLTFLRNGVKMLGDESDRLVHRLADINHLEGQLAEIGAVEGLEWPFDLKKLAGLKRKNAWNEISAWSQLNSQGHGIKDIARHPASNVWLRDSTYLSASRHINALKLRTNTLGTKVACMRADPNIDPYCRRCSEWGFQIPESLGHVLGECIAGKPARIHRHNEIVEVVRDACLQAKYTVTHEQEYRWNHHGEQIRRKPDLVVKNSSGVWILDVTVRYEDNDWINRGVHDKVTNYVELLSHLKQLYNLREGSIMALLVGSRGAIPRVTEKALKSLGIYSRQLAITCAMIAVRSSLAIALGHLDFRGR